MGKNTTWKKRLTYYYLFDILKIRFGKTRKTQSYS